MPLETSAPPAHTPERRYPAATLRAFARGCFEACGVPPADAEVSAANLSDSDLRGIDSHGVPRLLQGYVARLEAGGINPRPTMRVLEEGPVTALLDADNALGAVAGTRAMRLCAEKARAVGAAWVGVRHSNHFGACAYYTNQMAGQGLVGIAFTNAPPAMAPWGGVDAYLGTNPVCFSFPTRSGVPISVDMATSVAARGYILLALARGEHSIPAGWAQDERGRPTTDPHAALRGSVLPMGGHKGYALAVMVELLCGVLTGASFGQRIVQLNADLHRPQDVGHFLGAFDIARFMPLDLFYDRVERMAGELHASPLAEGAAPILLPGEMEANRTAERARDGVPLAEPIREAFVAMGQRLGVPFE